MAERTGPRHRGATGEIKGHVREESGRAKCRGHAWTDGAGNSKACKPSGRFRFLASEQREASERPGEAE